MQADTTHVQELDGAEERLALLEERLKIMLPDQYRDSYENVEPVPMRSAGLVYREGKVAWNEIWTSFCDLAMAGGPPHRGRLLEPGMKAQVQGAPELYRQVTEEICRGIQLVTGLYAEPSPALGWVQMYCTSAAMADWLLRAITMENVSAHRQGLVLSLPAAPDFRLEKEIKNVVTVVAKTTHYWQDHTSEDRQQGIAQLFTELNAETNLVQPPLESLDPRSHAEQEQFRSEIVTLVCEATGLRPVDHASPGWAGFECGSVPKAVTLMRFLIVSNLLARREETKIFVSFARAGKQEREDLVRRFRSVHRSASRHAEQKQERVGHS